MEWLIIKKIFSLILCIIIPISLLAGCNKSKEAETGDLVKVRLNEVVRSVFYAPMYIAINEGYFKEEGIDIDLSTGQGAEPTITVTQV